MPLSGRKPDYSMTSLDDREEGEGLSEAEHLDGLHANGKVAPQQPYRCMWRSKKRGPVSGCPSPVETGWVFRVRDIPQRWPAMSFSNSSNKSMTRGANCGLMDRSKLRALRSSPYDNQPAVPTIHDRNAAILGLLAACRACRTQ